MAQTVTLWFGQRKFYVSPTRISSFKGLKISSSVATEDKDVGGEKIVSKKSIGVTQVDLTAILNAFAGSNVQEEALELIDACQKAEEGFIYDGKGAKIWPFRLMLVSAKISTCEIGPGGVWSYAEVELSFKQSTTSTGATAGSDAKGGGGGGSGTKKEYKIQIGGKTYIKTAGSRQEALTAALKEAGKPELTGTVLIDGSGCYVEKGKLKTLIDTAVVKATDAEKRGKQAEDIDVQGKKGKTEKFPMKVTQSTK